MKKLLDRIGQELASAFRAAGYDESYAKAARSNRPDLCEFQCNGALAAAKAYKKPPMQIANEVAAHLGGRELFAQVDVAAPGFLNMKLSGAYLASYLNEMDQDADLLVEQASAPQTIVLDYGGANVAKPLHVGHLRSAVIGESIKRLKRYMGHRVIGDVHLGDWGLQMGLILTEVRHRQPDLPYFQEDFTGEYPEEAPFTLSDLEEIYPTASSRAKEDDAYRREAQAATQLLQQGKPGYRALWRHIMRISVADLKKNYANLHVEFDVWKGESDTEPYIAGMVADMRKKGIARLDQGAWVVDVKEEGDTKEIPPCIVLKSDGAYLYATTDLATIVQRMQDYRPDEIFYLTDKRQEMHFTQVFRCARKAGIVGEGTKLTFLGFGTMNGKDGSPFRTRQGGVMRLEDLIGDIQKEMAQKIMDNHAIDPDEAMETAKIVGLAAIKYGDLSNQATKDYVFDPDRFTSFEGNTGPYILYTVVRIKSIRKKYREHHQDDKEMGGVCPPAGEGERAWMLELARFNAMMENAAEEAAPHKVCAYLYGLANAFNHFYHESKILSEPDARRQASWVALLALTQRVMEACIWTLGFEAPERM